MAEAEAEALVQPAEPAAAQPASTGLWAQIRKLIFEYTPTQLGVFVAVATVVGTAVFDRGQLWPSLRYALLNMLGMSPLAIGAFALNGFLKAADANNAVMGIFEGRTAVIVVGASLLGALSPLCSCTVIPMIVVLMQAAVPLGPIMAFWMSSPIVSPDSFAMTAAVLGFNIATARLLAAIGVGLFAGFATMLIQRFGLLANPLHPKLMLEAAGRSFKVNSGQVKAHWKFWKEPERRQIFRAEFVNTAKLLTAWLFVAFMGESLMSAHVTGDFMAGLLGKDSAWAIPLAAGAGVPLYLSGAMAIPLVDGLMRTGMSPGAALAFIVGGAVTSIPAIMAVFPITRRPVFVWYMIVAMVGAIASGYAYQMVLALMH